MNLKISTNREIRRQRLGCRLIESTATHSVELEYAPLGFSRLTVLRFRAPSLLKMADQEMLLADGLPKRPWFKHSLYAPGLYTGYGVKTMPGAREAIDSHDWGMANVQLTRIAGALDKEAALIHKAANVLEKKNVVP